MNWDVFVSHAFEDKEFAHALADGLSEKGLQVWYDEFELKVGDSLRRSIDYGLSKSRFGAVVLSPSFFAKEWTKKELGALTARETNNKKIILPVWHNISVHEIRKHSPMLADRYAVNSIAGIEKTVEHLFIEIKKYKLKQRRKNVDSFIHRNLSVEELEQITSELKKIKYSLSVKETELTAVLAQADEVAHTDDLTYLPNRRSIIADLKREVLFSGKYNMPLSAVIVDIDHFKRINDTHGHIVGDEILRDFASIIREPIYHPNVIGRYAGAEFLLVMPHSTLEEASRLAEYLCERIRSTPFLFQEKVFHLTISVGIAQYKFHEEAWIGFLDRADKALYRAKSSGRDRWTVAK